MLQLERPLYLWRFVWMCPCMITMTMIQLKDVFINYIDLPLPNDAEERSRTRHRGPGATETTSRRLLQPSALGVHSGLNGEQRGEEGGGWRRKGGTKR